MNLNYLLHRELLDNKLIECSEKINKNPNDYQITN